MAKRKENRVQWLIRIPEELRTAVTARAKELSTETKKFDENEVARQALEAFVADPAAGDWAKIAKYCREMTNPTEIGVMKLIATSAGTSEDFKEKIGVDKGTNSDV